MVLKKGTLSNQTTRLKVRLHFQGKPTAFRLETVLYKTLQAAYQCPECRLFWKLRGNYFCCNQLTEKRAAEGGKLDVLKKIECIFVHLSEAADVIVIVYLFFDSLKRMCTLVFDCFVSR